MLTDLFIPKSDVSSNKIQYSRHIFKLFGHIFILHLLSYLSLYSPNYLSEIVFDPKTSLTYLKIKMKLNKTTTNSCTTFKDPLPKISKNTHWKLKCEKDGVQQ